MNYMKPHTHNPSRHSLASSILLLAAWALSAASQAATITPAPFTANNPIGGAPVGWTFAGNKFVGSILDNGTGQNLLYSTDLTGGNIQPFGGAVTLAPTFGSEHYVSSSRGLGGFANGDIFVASGNNIVHISNGGTPMGNFITGSLGGLNGDVRGITFDTVGTFSYNMLVTTHAGGVYMVDSAGNPTLIASTGEDTEGLDVAPLGGIWGGKNGWLFVASEGSPGTIRAIDFAPAHTMLTMATIPSAEQLAFVPLNLGASGSPLEGLYAANYNQNVVKMDASQFAGLQGHIIVTGETTSDIWDLSAPFTASQVGSFPLQPEDGIFVTATMIPEPGTATLAALGGLSVIFTRRRVRSV
jgi:hypothetical protein